MEYTKQCSARVSRDDWGHTHQCEKKAIVERGGKPYCKIHDPEYIKAKDDERRAKFDKEWAEEKAYRELQNTAIRACKSINPDNPLAVAQSITDLYEALKAMLEGSEIAPLRSDEPIRVWERATPSEEAILNGFKALAKARVK